jgi:hypothetical protein
MEPAEPPPRRDVARDAPPRRDVVREPPLRRDVVREPYAPALQSAKESTKARGKRAGWLSDLLTRASQVDLPAAAGREPPPEAARLESHTMESHTMESLDSIAVDIARMIDPDAAAELWDRYQRGERNVFTRKLYTMQDERTFDEVQRKYHSDPEFMQTVDRYIAEFEQLLDEVSRDDRGQMVARSYLTSETGKVYTMLALAAGRLD